MTTSIGNGRQLSVRESCGLPGRERGVLRTVLDSVAARRGGKRALVAVMHKLAIAIWHVLHDKVP